MMFERISATEGSSKTVTFTLKDESNNPVQLSAIDSATLTLTNFHSRSIINGRQAQNVKNANNVTIAATSGLVTWAMQPADNQITTSLSVREELHRATFHFVVGTITLNYEFEIMVTNLLGA